MALVHAARNWPTVEGVIESFLRDDSAQGGRGMLLAGPANPFVEYTYEVAGRQYQGKRYRFGPDKYYGRESMPTYQRGDAVRVHHSPQWPSWCVIHTGIQSTATLHLVFALMLITPALFGIFE